MNASKLRDALLRVVLRSIPLVSVPEVYDVIRALRENETSVDKQVQEAVEALSRSSHLIDDLGRTLKEREKRLCDLQDEYKKTTALASMTFEQGEAVAKALADVLGQSRTRSRIEAFAINIFAGLVLLVIGVLISDWVKSILLTLFRGLA